MNSRHRRIFFVTARTSIYNYQTFVFLFCNFYAFVQSRLPFWTWRISYKYGHRFSPSIEQKLHELVIAHSILR